MWWFLPLETNAYFAGALKWKEIPSSAPKRNPTCLTPGMVTSWVLPSESFLDSAKPPGLHSSPHHWLASLLVKLDLYPSDHLKIRSQLTPPCWETEWLHLALLPFTFSSTHMEISILKRGKHHGLLTSLWPACGLVSRDCDAFAYRRLGGMRGVYVNHSTQDENIGGKIQPPDD